MRNIERVIAPGGYNWVGDGFYVASYAGNLIARRRIDPFFVVDYNPEIKFEPRNTPRGVGAHPHKGFETVTVAYQGKVAHKDSRGNTGVIEQGDVQWMTAGAGILHQEYHEENFSKMGGLFQMVQLWVNLPAKYKEVTPGYQDIKSDEIPTVKLDDHGNIVKIIAGEYRGVTGKAHTYSPVNMYNVHLNDGGTASFDFPNHYNTFFIVIKGSVMVNGTEAIAQDSFVLLENNGDTRFDLTATTPDTTVLMLSGEPLNEPVAHYGPFVMNTQEELIKAFEDFQAGKFGVL